jgi:hypothetical protein
MRKGASCNGYRIGPRKVRRADTVYELKPSTSSGQETASDEAGQTPVAPVPACDRVGLLLPPDGVAVFACGDDLATAQTLLAQLAALVERLAQGAGGVAYRQYLLSRAGDGRVLERFRLV